jgi:hypothetical protein
MHHPEFKHLSDGGTSSIGMIESYDPVIDMANASLHSQICRTENLGAECHYTGDYWTMTYKNGSTPMKEMEGRSCFAGLLILS